jgi:primase-polymerase (primpol)-like protein
MDTTYPGPTTDNISNFPAALAPLKRWLLWRGGDRVDQATGEIKLNKVPVNPYDLTNADTTDPLTWGTLRECIDALPLALEEWETEDPDAYRGGGIGFVFTAQDNLVGFDLDSCVDPVTGEIEEWAANIVQTLDSYTEITPSGTGLHVIAEGTLPPRGRRKGAIEMYSTQRFFTMTGWRLVDAPDAVYARQPEIDRVWCRVFGARVGQPVWLKDTQGNITNPAPYVIASIQDRQGLRLR